jgi:hypothetical protein
MSAKLLIAQSDVLTMSVSLQDSRDSLHYLDYSQDDFLQFLRNKLEIDGYWKKVGIS